VQTEAAQTLDWRDITEAVQMAKGESICIKTDLQLLWQLHEEPGVLLDVLQRDALVRIRHKYPRDQVFAVIAELHIRWEAVYCLDDALQQNNDAGSDTANMRP
jgi:hypothetical protein